MVSNNDEPVRFERDIKPLFRPRDQQSMKSHFDLWTYTDVSEHADTILAACATGRCRVMAPGPKLRSNSSSVGAMPERSTESSPHPEGHDL